MKFINHILSWNSHVTKNFVNSRTIENYIERNKHLNFNTRYNFWQTNESLESFTFIYFLFNSEKCNSWEPLLRKGSHCAILRGLELDMQKRLISYKDLQASTLKVVVLKTYTIIPRQVRITLPNLLA